MDGAPVDGAPSAVWTFLVAGGSAVPWFFLDLNKKAIVKTVVVGRSRRCSRNPRSGRG